MKHMTIPKLTFLQTLLGLSIVIGIGFIGVQKVYAYTAAEINSRMPDAQNQIVNTENSCFNDLVNENSINRRAPKTDTDRDNINDSNPYRDFAWVSYQGQPTTTTVGVPYGTQKVGLQLNKMMFICAALVKDNITAPSDIDDGSSIVNAGNFPDDRAPNPTSLSPSTHAASLLGVNTRINSANVSSGGGTVNVTPGTVYSMPRDNNSRYWFASAVPFTYDAGAPMTSSRTITIHFNISDIRSYPSAHQCDNPSGGPLDVASDTDFGPCKGRDVYFDLRIEVPSSSSDDGVSVSCDLNNFLTGWAFDWDKYDGDMYDQAGNYSNNTGSVFVHVYVDSAGDPNPASPAIPPTGKLADVDRPDVNAARGITGKHGFIFKFSDFNAEMQARLNSPGTHTIHIYKIGVDSTGHTDGVNPELDGSPTTYDGGSCTPPPPPPPPTSFSCSLTPLGNQEINTPFQVDFKAIVTNGTGDYTYTASLSGDASKTPSDNPQIITANPDGSADDYFSGISFSTVGLKSMTVTINFSGPSSGTATCRFNGNPSSGPCAEQCGPFAVARPFFNLTNGDIATGISGSCPGWSGGSGRLTAWNNGLSAGNKGANTNLAAFALSTIDGFASARDTTPIIGLTFANTSGTYGGNLSGGAACPMDYYGTLPASGTFPTGSVQDNNGIYTASGPLTLNGGSVTGGHRTIIYVNGDVHIINDITISSGATINQLSSFWLVVRGNIYIAPGVSRLDGVYVAQNAKIYTCALGFGVPNGSQINNNCQTKLTVNGSFIAKELKLYRSFGTLSSNQPAEIFNYNPALWLAAPCSISQSCSTGSANNGYDAITSLPPIL